jgi:hypothetical protein
MRSVSWNRLGRSVSTSVPAVRVSCPQLPKSAHTVKTEERTDHAPAYGKEIVKSDDGAGVTGFDQQHDPKCTAEQDNDPTLPPERTQSAQSLHPLACPSVDVAKVPEAPVHQYACPWHGDTTVRYV